MLDDLGRAVLCFCAFVLCTGLVLVLVSLKQPSGFQTALVGLCSLVGIAAGSVGGVLGFLFGIPRTLTAESGASGDVASEGGRTRHTRSNTNLEQISDWLTKIVVGATLVQINTIWPGLVAFGRDFEAEVIRLPGLSNLTGLAGLVPVMILIGFAAGFLMIYLQTRTFLALMFARIEHVMDDVRLAGNDISTLHQAAARVASLGAAAVLTKDERELAQRALIGEVSATDDTDALKQRGFAEVIGGNWSLGADLIKQASKLAGDQELARLAARLLARTNRPGEAKDLLGSIPLPSEGVSLPPEDVDALLARMFASLYEAPPLGFKEALKIGRSLQGQASIEASTHRAARLELYTAAARGQCYSWQRENGPREEMPDLRADILKNVAEALRLDRSTRSSLQNMLNHTGEDDDLVAFKNDPEFRRLIDGDGQG